MVGEKMTNLLLLHQKLLNYSVLADNTAEIANIEEFAVCIRWVDSEFYAHEEFSGIHLICSTTTENIQKIISDVLLRLELVINNANRQSYDEAPLVMEHKSGAATRFQMENKMLSIHCLRHALSFSVNHLKLMKNTFQYISKVICNLVKKSPREEIPNLLFYKQNLGRHTKVCKPFP